MANKRRNRRRAAKPKEVSLDELIERTEKDPRHVNPEEEPTLRDSNSSRGDLYWDAEDEVTSDNDVRDALYANEPESGHAGGAIGGTPVNGRTVEHVRHGISSPGSKRGDSTIGSDPMRARD